MSRRRARARLPAARSRSCGSEGTTSRSPRATTRRRCSCSSCTGSRRRCSAGTADARGWQGAGARARGSARSPLGEAARVRPRARPRLARADDERARARHPERHDARLRVRLLQHQLGCRAAKRVVVPDSIPPSASSASAPSRRSSCAIRGSRRSTTSPTSSPTRACSSALGVDRERVARRAPPAARRLALPPALEPALPADARPLGGHDGVQAVVLPRTEEQREYVTRPRAAVRDRARARRRRAEPDRRSPTWSSRPAAR